MKGKHIAAIVLGIALLIGVRDALVVNADRSQDLGGASREFADRAKQGLAEYEEIKRRGELKQTDLDAYHEEYCMKFPRLSTGVEEWHCPD